MNAAVAAGQVSARDSAATSALWAIGLVPDKTNPGRTQDASYAAVDLAYQVTKKTKAWVSGSGLTGGASAIAGIVAAINGRSDAVVIALVAAGTVLIVSMVAALAVVTRQDVQSRTELAEANLRARAEVYRQLMESLDRAAEPPQPPSPPTREPETEPTFAELLRELDHTQDDAERFGRAHPELFA